MQKINFQNLPNTTTPVNATNLNQMQTNIENEFTGTSWLGTGMNNSFTYYKKRSGWCIVKFTCFGSATLSSTELTLGTLPVGYRPSDTIYFMFNGISGDVSTFYGRVNTSGDIVVGTGSGSTTYFAGSVVFPVDG